MNDCDYEGVDHEDDNDHDPEDNDGSDYMTMMRMVR